MLTKFKNKFAKEGEVYLKVKVRPNASKTEIKDLMKNDKEEIYKIDVSAPAANNKANKELINYISHEFATGKDNVKIISGASSQIKLIKIKI